MSLFCLEDDCNNVQVVGGYCLDHQLQHAAVLVEQRDELWVMLQAEITRRKSAEAGLAEMIKAHSEAMTRLSKYEKVTS